LAPVKYDQEVALVAQKVESFRTAAKARLDGCFEQIERLKTQGKRVALWGAGARAVIYLNMLGHERAKTIGCAVDLNPRKHGMFLPGTGQQILAPAELPGFEPDVVLLMNPIYREEIAASLKDLRVDAELCLV